MCRQEKIIIFTGPTEALNEYIMKYYNEGEKNYNLTQLVNISEMERNTHLIALPGQADDSQEKVRKPIDLLIVSVNEYSGVTEAVTNNFVNFISKYDIKKIIIQNPPDTIINDLRKQYDVKDIYEHFHDYNVITADRIKYFYKLCSDTILGQELAIQKVTQMLIIQEKLNKEKKPIVIMLYGPSGVGKTETGKKLAQALGGKMFYSQFSMFQNEGHLNYLYGDKVQVPSFAKDLLNRTSNVIFLDEFDKANRFVYSALYQLFDEGVFTDNNFHVDLKNTIIICTSNYEKVEEIYKHLGEPMFYRINCVIKYEALSKEVKEKLVEKYYNNLCAELNQRDRVLVEKMEIKDKYIKCSDKIENARQIENFIRNDIAKVLATDLLCDEENVETNG